MGVRRDKWVRKMGGYASMDAGRVCLESRYHSIVMRLRWGVRPSGVRLRA